MLRYPHRQAFVLVATQHGPLLVNRMDAMVLDTGSAFGVGLALLEHGHHELGEIEFAAQLMQLRAQHHGDGVVVLDCGANIGAHTVSWARFMTGWGEVWAFEPQERIFYALCGNIVLNNCFNARAFEAVVGERDGAMEIPVLDYQQPASFGSLELRKSPKNELIGQPVSYDTNTVEVAQLCIDSIDLPRVDVIKMDIEGMEIEALEGARKTVDKHRPVLIVEMLKTDTAAVTAYFEEYNYRTFACGMNMVAVCNDDPIIAHINPSHSSG